MKIQDVGSGKYSAHPCHQAAVLIRTGNPRLYFLIKVRNRKIRMKIVLVVATTNLPGCPSIIFGSSLLWTTSRNTSGVLTQATQKTHRTKTRGRALQGPHSRCSTILHHFDASHDRNGLLLDVDEYLPGIDYVLMLLYMYRFNTLCQPYPAVAVRVSVACSFRCNASNIATSHTQSSVRPGIVVQTSAILNPRFTTNRQLKPLVEIR